MDNYVIRSQVNEQMIYLELPLARRQKLFTYMEEDEHAEKNYRSLILKAVRYGKLVNTKRKQNFPLIYRGYDEVDLKNTLRKILSRHPFPYLQGPLIMERDCSFHPDIFNAKTRFFHINEQPGSEWTPDGCGLEGWGIHIQNTEDYVDQTNQKETVK